MQSEKRRQINTVFLVQWPRSGRFSSDIQWVLAEDFSAYDTLAQARAALEHQLEGEWSAVVSRSGGYTEIRSTHHYLGKRSKPLARIIGMEVAHAG
jgi:hypothetical protein